MYNVFLWLARLGTVLALIVVTVGAWVRLTDAGLGCPDWPGCYGQLIVSEQLEVDASVQNDFGRTLDSGKAWREMFHRYLASTLGLICVALAGIAWVNRRDPRQPWRVPLVLVALVIFQGLLGMWTVTLLLKPIIVVAHLLGGFATLALLFWLARGRVPALVGGARLRVLATAALAALILQIALGGWTSANYAALACPDFPTCQTQWWPELADFDEAFVLWRGIGVDYEGGVLDGPARTAIHLAHRWFALLVFGHLLVVALKLRRSPGLARWGVALGVLLGAQVALGISNVLYGLPLSVAVAHNAGAALLLGLLVTLLARLQGTGGYHAGPPPARSRG